MSIAIPLNQQMEGVGVS